VEATPNKVRAPPLPAPSRQLATLSGQLFTGRSSEGKDRSNVYKSTKIKRFQIEMNHNEMPILGEGGANEGDERGGLAPK
jgi:hypothetical protein